MEIDPAINLVDAEPPGQDMGDQISLSSSPERDPEDYISDQWPYPTQGQDATPANDDSGYGSLAAKSVALGNLKLDTVQELDEAAATNTVHPSLDDDNRTVFSSAASLLQNPNVDKYISAFANELAD